MKTPLILTFGIITFISMIACFPIDIKTTIVIFGISVGVGLIAWLLLIVDNKSKIKYIDSYNAIKKELLEHKEDVNKAMTKEELRIVFHRTREYQNKFSRTKENEYFNYMADYCMGIIKGKLDMIQHKKDNNNLPDHYSGELNTERIKRYKKLAECYNITESSVRDIFCKGADWYKDLL